jgi:hypothetical protein
MQERWDWGPEGPWTDDLPSPGHHSHLYNGPAMPVLAEVIVCETWNQHPAPQGGLMQGDSMGEELAVLMLTLPPHFCWEGQAQRGHSLDVMSRSW